jgi:hypothetical protein
MELPLAFDQIPLKSRLYSIALISCLVVPLATCFVMLQWQKKQVRKVVKWNLIANVDHQELVHLTLSAEEQQTQLRWEHEGEFEYRGEMYDVVKTEVIGNSTHFTLWHDSEETRLNKKLDELVAIALGENPKKQENEQKVNDFFKSLFIANDPINSEIIVLAENTKYHPAKNYRQQGAHSPPVPPPEI